jgi:hypothetical protein
LPPAGSEQPVLCAIDAARFQAQASKAVGGAGSLGTAARRTAAPVLGLATQHHPAFLCTPRQVGSFLCTPRQVGAARAARSGGSGADPTPERTHAGGAGVPANRRAATAPRDVAHVRRQRSQPRVRAGIVGVAAFVLLRSPSMPSLGRRCSSWGKVLEEQMNPSSAKETFLRCHTKTKKSLLRGRATR